MHVHECHVHNRWPQLVEVGGRTELWRELVVRAGVGEDNDEDIRKARELFGAFWAAGDLAILD